MSNKLKSELEELDNAAMEAHVAYIATTNDFKIASDLYDVALAATSRYGWDETHEDYIAASKAYDVANAAANTAQKVYCDALYAGAMCLGKIINKGKLNG